MYLQVGTPLGALRGQTLATPIISHAAAVVMLLVLALLVLAH
jgi:hypothetical protein